MGCCVGDCCVLDCGFCCIFDSCSDSGCSFTSPINNSIDHSKIIAAELDEMKKRAHTEGEKDCNEAFTLINQFMNPFIEYIKKVNENTYGGKKLNIKVDIIEQEFEKLRQEVIHFIGNRMEDRLVLTDSELSVILDERDDEERTKNFNAFYEKVHKQALLDLSDKIEEVITKQFSIVDAEIGDRLQEVNQSMKMALEEYEQAEKLKKENSSELKEKEINSMYKITIAEILLNELKKDVK